MVQPCIVSSYSIDVHDVVITTLGQECISLNDGAAFSLAAALEDANWIGVGQYLCDNLCTQTLTGLCTPRKPLLNLHLNLSCVSDWKCEFGL